MLVVRLAVLSAAKKVARKDSRLVGCWDMSWVGMKDEH